MKAIEEKVMDYLHDGPASIGDLACEVGMSVSTVKRVIRNLSDTGLVSVFADVKNEAGKVQRHYQLARTRKAA